MFCSQCSTKNPDGAAFCGRCGAPLAHTAPQQENPAQGQNTSNPPLADQKTRGRFRKTDDRFAAKHDAADASAEARPYSLRRGVLISILHFVVYMAVASVTATVILPFTAGWYSSVLQIIQFPVGIAVYRYLRRQRPEDTIRKIPKKNFRLLLLFYLVFIQIPVQCAFPYLMGTMNTFGEEAPWSILLNQFLLAPFVEETIFRGVLFSLSRKHLDFRPAALINAALFSFMHLGSISTMLMTFLMGLLFCSLVEATGYIRYGMALHFTFNFLALPMMLVAHFVPVFIALPLFVVAVVLHILMIIKRDKLISKLLPMENIEIGGKT